MVGGAGYPEGPLTLPDLIGHDIMLAVADAFMVECEDPRYAAPPLLKPMVEAGRLGRKSGEGFFHLHLRAACLRCRGVTRQLFGRRSTREAVQAGPWEPAQRPAIVV